MKEKVSHVSAYLTFLTLGLFALCAVMAVLMGAKSYRSVAQKSREADDSRRAVRYLSTRVQQSQEMVSVEDFEGVTALVLSESVEGNRYLTRIYCHEGYLKELYAAQSGSFTPADGEKLFEISSLSFREKDGLLLITAVMPNGESYDLSFCVKQEVLP